MKKVLVTGGFGFIGSNWINKYHKQYDIRVVDAILTGADVTNIRHDVPMAKMNVCDINEDYYTDFSPDVILHFAAESHVDRSISDPLSFVKSNVLGTSALLDLMKRITPNSRFVHVSTDEVYGHLGKDDAPFNEQSVYAPRSPYSASKASSDLMVMSYYNTFDLDVVITHCCNNYGVNQHSEKLIPTVIKKALSGEKIPVYGTGNNVREWIHVDDHNSALTLIMEKGVKGESYCIGSGVEKTNMEVVKQICDCLERDFKKETPYIDQVSFVEDRLGHDFRYAVDCSKLKQLGWKTEKYFETGIRNTVKHYKSKWRDL